MLACSIQHSDVKKLRTTIDRIGTTTEHSANPYSQQLSHFIKTVFRPYSCVLDDIIHFLNFGLQKKKNKKKPACPRLGFYWPVWVPIDKCPIMSLYKVLHQQGGASIYSVFPHPVQGCTSQGRKAFNLDVGLSNYIWVSSSGAADTSISSYCHKNKSLSYQYRSLYIQGFIGLYSQKWEVNLPFSASKFSFSWARPANAGLDINF